jgi:type IX secretion system PorP/SprF family membrane protein
MKAITLIIAGMVFINIHSQQEYSFTHYFETNSFYNPASTGSEQSQNIVGLFRKQWAGFTGSPTTGGLLYENKLKDYNMGIGGYVFTDKIGETCMTTATANYSYNLSFSNDLKLAFGIDAGADFLTTNVDRLIYWDQADQLLTNSKLSYVVPKIGLGTHLYNENFYVGVSVPRILNFNSKDFHSIRNPNLPMVVSHYYLTAGYKFNLNEHLAMKTNTLLKYTRGVQPQIDINATCTYNELIGLGVGYKSLGFITSYIQYTYDNTVMIGYAFDFSVNPMAQYARGGTHELMIKYRIKSRKSSSKI